jgi:F420-non-reducing hydrogenase iron-sulfur subunit
MLMRKLLEHVGVDPGRVNMSWVSASEGAKFKEVIDETVAKAKEAGPMEQFRRRQLNW